jgi:hypothetical protein
VLLPIKEQDVPAAVVPAAALNPKTQQLAKSVFNNVSLPVQLSHLTMGANTDVHPDAIFEADELKDRKASVSSTSSGNNNSNHLKRGEVYV